jgi:hypothetical protein
MLVGIATPKVDEQAGSADNDSRERAEQHRSEDDRQRPN